MKRLLIAALAAAVGCMATEKDGTAVSLVEQGNAAFTRRDFGEAQKKFENAVKLLREFDSGPESLLGIALGNLGSALAEQGKRDASAAALSEALALLSRSLGPNDLRSLNVANALASVEMLRGNFGHAKALFEAALPILRELHPADVQLARTLVGLSGVCLLEKRFEDARRLATEALTICINSEGDSGVNTATMYNALAQAYLAGGNSERALPLYRKAVVLYERLLGPDSVRSLQIHPNYAWSLLLNGRPAQAENELREALQSLPRICPSCHRERWHLEYTLGLLKFRQGKLLDADRLLTQVVETQEAHIDKPGIDLARSLRALAMIREKRGLHEDAVGLIERADKLSRR